MVAQRMKLRISLLAIVGILSCTYAPAQTEETTLRTELPDILAQFETRPLTLPGGKRMNCHRRPGRGPVLVLVPGTWGDLRTFTPLVAKLPVDLPLVVIELCWQGGHVPPRFDLSIEELAEDVLWVIKKLQLKDFYISGHSIGGMIAVEIAGREKVAGLVGAIAMEGWTHHSVTKTAFGGIVTDGLTPAQEARRQANRARGRGHLTERQRKAIATIWRRWNGYESLRQSKVPILHVWGDRGQPRPDRVAMQIPDRRSIEIAWIVGSSHALLIEEPQALANVIREFIRQ